MNEKPILFSGEMVCAILDGRKTQTRRVMKVQHFKLDGGGTPYIDKGYPDQWDGAGLREDIRCPYGYPGDRLWVRETWATIPLYDTIKPSRLIPSGTDLFWKADNSQTRYNKTEPGKWRPSIFMPRWASRISLEILSIRVERVQDITSADALAEGIDKAMAEEATNWNDYGTGSLYVDQFAALWDSINAKRGYSWASNPWAWVIEFKKENDR